MLRPTAMLFRNLASMDVEEAICGNPLDGVVLLMGAASVDLPTIGISGGLMLRGVYKGKHIGSGTNTISMSEQLRSGQITVRARSRCRSSMRPRLPCTALRGTA